MKTIFFTDYNSDELKSRVNSIIEVEKNDNFHTHFRHVVLFKDKNKVAGIIKNDCFKIWIPFSLIGIFYPIITGGLRSLAQGTEIKLKVKMNIIGKIIYIILLTALAYGIITLIIIQKNNTLNFLINRTFIGIALFALIISVPQFIFFEASMNIKHHILIELKIKNYT